MTEQANNEQTKNDAPPDNAADKKPPEGQQPPADKKPGDTPPGDKKPAEKAEGFLKLGKEPPKTEGADDKAPKDKSKEGEGDDGEDDKGDVFKPEDLKLPEGVELDDATKTIVSDLNKTIAEAKTPQERMQAIADAHIKVGQMQSDQWEATKKAWFNEVMTDPEIGGKNAPAVQGACDEVIRRFASDPQFGGSEELLTDLQEDLIFLGLGNKKSFVKFLNNIAKATGEGKSDVGRGGTGKVESKGAASTLYPDMAP